MSDHLTIDSADQVTLPGSVFRAMHQREAKMREALERIARPLTPPGKTEDDKADIHEIVDMLTERTAIARHVLSSEY